MERRIKWAIRTVIIVVLITLGTYVVNAQVEPNTGTRIVVEVNGTNYLWTMNEALNVRSQIDSLMGPVTPPPDTTGLYLRYGVYSDFIQFKVGAVYTREFGNRTFIVMPR
jgi:hypothetical protein